MIPFSIRAAPDHRLVLLNQTAHRKTPSPHRRPQSGSETCWSPLARHLRGFDRPPEHGRNVGPVDFSIPEVHPQALAGPRGTARFTARCSCPPRPLRCSRRSPGRRRGFPCARAVGRPPAGPWLWPGIGLLGLGQLDLHLDDTIDGQQGACGHRRLISPRWLVDSPVKARRNTARIALYPNLADPGSSSRVRHCRHHTGISRAFEGRSALAIPLSHP